MQNATQTKAGDRLKGRILRGLNDRQYLAWLRSKWHPVACTCGVTSQRVMGA